MITELTRLSTLVTYAHLFLSDCQEEEIDIYQQLAEKDHYLILAAEAGKVLLEKNQELTKHFEALQEEYHHKIEVRFISLIVFRQVLLVTYALHIYSIKMSKYQ